jgi:Ion channel
MAPLLSQTAFRTTLMRSLHLWRVGLLCAGLTHERQHPALALLVLVPLNHMLFRLTAGLDPSAAAKSSHKNLLRRALLHTPSRPTHAGIVVGVYVLASSGVIWWYGSLAALIADVREFSKTWEWWAMVAALTALTVLYRPLGRELRHFFGATGLRDSRLWTALGLAISVWVWCGAVFAALYQKLSVLCTDSALPLCQGQRPFSQSLARFADAAYFSTITLSTTGYGDIVPMSDVARAIVSVEIIIGYGLLGFLLSRVAGLGSTSTPAQDDGAEERS